MARLLIVEDNPLNLELFTQMLEDDHAIETATDGEAGVAAAKASVPELILMDISMPRLDGFQAVALLRADERTKSVPVVAVTAHAIRGDKERILAAGFDAYVSKPIDEDVLKATIDRLLKGRT
ncbi:MAG: response regulator [Deltaproteobacteria bacterium]|nr:response regulator [Deltaproteobacteria bacterium]